MPPDLPTADPLDDNPDQGAWDGEETAGDRPEAAQDPSDTDEKPGPGWVRYTDEPPPEDAIAHRLQGTQQEREAAFVELVQAYQRRLMNFLGKRFPGISPDDRADAIQTVFEKLWEKVLKKDFDFTRPVVPWLFNVAFNQAVTIYRKRKRACLTDPTELDENTAQPSAPQGGDAAWTEDQIARFAQFMASLPPKQRMVAHAIGANLDGDIDIGASKKLNHSHVAEWVAAKFGVSLNENQVKDGLQQVRKKFKQLLQEETRP